MNENKQNRKNIMEIVAGYVLLWLSMTSSILGDGEYLTEKMKVGFILMVVMSLIAQATPLICYIVNHGALESISGKRICKWNSISLLIISILLMAFGVNIIVVGWLGAYIYYVINRNLFVDYLSGDSNKKKNIDAKVVDNKKIKSKKVLYCDNCNHVVDITDKFCKNCGYEFED